MSSGVSNRIPNETRPIVDQSSLQSRASGRTYVKICGHTMEEGSFKNLLKVIGAVSAVIIGEAALLLSFAATPIVGASVGVIGIFAVTAALTLANFAAERFTE